MRRSLLALLIVIAAVITASGTAAPRVGPVPPDFRPASVTFVSASQGWVLGSAPCAHPPCTSIVRTLDGGRTWRGIHAPRTPLLRFPDANAPGVLTLRFADSRDGWAFGTQLWATHDGGSTWHRLALPGRRPDVVALEAGAGQARALIGSLPAGGGPPRGVRVYTAAVGSDRWRAGPAMPGAYELVVHGAHAWILTESFQPTSLALRLYAGSGSSWRRLSVPCNRTYSAIGQLAASSASRLLFICASLPGAGSQDKRAYVSRDGGRTWARRGQPSHGGDLYYAASSSATGDFTAAASGATEIYGSFDGARHWRTVLGLLDGGLGWSDFGFTTPTQGVAVEGRPSQGQSRMWMTRDGGHHWSAVRF